ncbi:unnamed protein product [Prunus armeniaca]|uniref:Pentatricopeptide repeat-containing protein n=1 Tax=Prunus armeniaca TaxID=36596 RepID=A0A6J5VIN0_PRUAR|nr:unnamed protein product [Prunus armeniaca]
MGEITAKLQGAAPLVLHQKSNNTRTVISVHYLSPSRVNGFLGIIQPENGEFHDSSQMSGSGCLRSLMLTLNQFPEPLFSHRFPRHFRNQLTLTTKPTSFINPHKWFCGNVTRLSSAEYSNAAAKAHIFDGSLVHQNESIQMGLNSCIRWKHIAFELIVRLILAFKRVLKFWVLVICDGLTDAYLACGDLDGAVKKLTSHVLDLFSRMIVDNVHPDETTFARNGWEKEAVLLFIQMQTSGILPTPYVFSSVLSACTKIELFEMGAQLHGLIFKGGFSCENLCMQCTCDIIFPLRELHIC